MTTRADLIKAAAEALQEAEHVLPDSYEAHAEYILDVVLPQVSTVEQLEALPVETQLMSDIGTPLRWVGDELFGGYARWKPADALKHFGPLTVVWQPSADRSFTCVCGETKREPR